MRHVAQANHVHVCYDVYGDADRPATPRSPATSDGPATFASPTTSDSPATTDGQPASDARGAAGADAVVLLHGLGLDRSSWSAVGAELADTVEERRVYALDLRGHGDSDWPGDYSYELMRDDVVDFVQTLRLRRVVLIGHSMGGVVAWLVAQQRPDWLTRLVVEDVAPPRVGMAPTALRDRPDGPLPFDWPVVPAIIGQLTLRTRPGGTTSPRSTCPRWSSPVGRTATCHRSCSLRSWAASRARG